MTALALPTRRGFIAGAIALLAAPAIVKASSLMPVPAGRLLRLWGDGLHDDTLAMQQRISMSSAEDPFILRGGDYRLGRSLVVGPGNWVDWYRFTLKATHDGHILDVSSPDAAASIRDGWFQGALISCLTSENR